VNGSTLFRGRRPLVPVAVAAVAVVAAVAAVVILVAVNRDDSDTTKPVTHPVSTRSSLPTATPTAPTSSTPTTERQPTLVGSRVGPWDAVVLARRPLFQLIGDRSSLYAMSGGSIVRMNPKGEVVARAPYQGIAGPWLVAGHVVVTTPSDLAGDAVRLARFDAITLARERSVVLHFGPLDSVGRMAAPQYTQAPDRATVYVGVGREVAVVDVAAGRVLRRIALPTGHIRALAVNDDGTVLYVAVEHTVYSVDVASGVVLGQTRVSATRVNAAITVSSDGTTMYAATVDNGYVETEVQAIDLGSGSTLATIPSGNGASSDGSGFVATDSGVFFRTGTGMLEQVFFASLQHPARPVSLETGGGGVLPTLTLTAEVAWLGGLSLGCADPSSGVLRDAARVPGRHGSVTAIYDLASAGGRTFAIYDGSGRRHALVELTPPAACRP
jgi:outer membrane protein assembly factor BamB